jgi:hypothetical protein
MKVTSLFNLVQRLRMSGVVVHSAIRLNLNLQFLSVGLSNVWIMPDGRLCVSFVLLREQAVQDGRYYHSLCIDHTLRYTKRCPVKRTLCIIRIVYVHFLSGTLGNTFNDPRTASCLRFSTFRFSFISGCQAYFYQLNFVLVCVTLRSYRSLKSLPRSSVGRLLTVLCVNWFCL